MVSGAAGGAGGLTGLPPRPRDTAATGYKSTLRPGLLSPRPKALLTSQAIFLLGSPHPGTLLSVSRSS